MGFQKVRTHDKADAKCRVKVQSWWGSNYPAEVEGSDPKSLEEIGKGRKCYIKIGDHSFNALRYALTDFKYRVSDEPAPAQHSYVRSVRFEGGLLDGAEARFSPNLNCLIGIRGSGKSAILESICYALDVKLGQETQDRDYKENLLSHIVKSGGKVIVTAMDRHGTQYEIHRILNHPPDIHVDGEHRAGIQIRETIVKRPLYFGQKDLSAAGKGFGQDLVEKLVGHELLPVRQTITARTEALEKSIQELLDIQALRENKAEQEAALQDVKFQLEQFDKHGLKDKLDKRLEFDKDSTQCKKLVELASSGETEIAAAIKSGRDGLAGSPEHTSKFNEALFEKINTKFKELQTAYAQGDQFVETIKNIRLELAALRDQFQELHEGAKEEFAEASREILQSLKEKGITSIEPDAYVKLSRRKEKLTAEIADLTKKAGEAQGRHDAVIKAASELNASWLQEFRLIENALKKLMKLNLIFRSHAHLRVTNLHWRNTWRIYSKAIISENKRIKTYLRSTFTAPQCSGT